MGGAYIESQKLVTGPYRKSGVRQLDRLQWWFECIKAQVETGAVTWDIIDEHVIQLSVATKACSKNLILQ